MAEKEKRALGAVAYNEDAMMLIAKALTNNEASTNSTAKCAAFNEKLRWAYLVVGYKESEKLRQDNKDNESLLKAIKSKYAPLVASAISENAASNIMQITTKRVIKDKKHIHLVPSMASASNSLEGLLKAFHMHAQAKALDDTRKEKGAMCTRMLLPFKMQECHQLIEEEQGNTKSNYKHHALAVVAWAYGYKGEDNALELIQAKNPIVALLPKVRFECGLFFDGTNNNKFNTQMRLDYEKYLDEKQEIIGLGSYSNGSLEQLIMSKETPKSKVLPLIFQDLKENINSYGDASLSKSKYDGGSWLLGMWQDKISSDADKIYEYFHNQDSRGVYDFIVAELLPSGADSSYTGDYTNVVKLYDLYSTARDSTAYKEQHLYTCYRKKLYITGAGTYDSRRTGKKEEDDLLGSALAISETGVVSKVEEACENLRVELKKLGMGYIDTLVLDVFGFSRGAAEARHFVGSISKELDCVSEREETSKDGKKYKVYTLAKKGENLYPYLIKEADDEKDNVVIDKIVFRFVGVFDTVPHYGLLQSNDAQELDLKLQHNKVSRVVHLTAKQEYRANFDLFSIKSSADEKLPKHFEEREFFGAHSDVGGGYNDGVSELVELPSQYYYKDRVANDKRVKALVQRWNNRYKWVDNEDIKFISDKDKINKNKDGLYILKRLYQHNQRNGAVHISARYYIYMNRARMEAEYSELPLEYMYKQAKYLIPMKNLTNLKYKNINILREKKESLLRLEVEALNDIRSKFIHHSSTAGVAHHPQRGNENILYGKRTIHYV